FLPGLDPGGRKFFDSSITVTVFALFFLTVLRRPSLRMQRGFFLEDMSVPLRLYGLLLLVVFLADFIESLLFLHLPVDAGKINRELIDPFIFTVVAAPFIWMVLVRPFKRTADAEKVVRDTLQAQVVDAIITTDEQGVIHSFNPAAERIFGYTAADMLGRRTDILLKGDQHLLDDMVREVVAGARSGRCAVSWEMTGWRCDGTVIYLDVSVSRVVLFDGQMFLLILRDIGVRKAMDEALRASEERFRIVAEAANEGIWDCDLASGRLYFTPRFIEMLGFREDELERSFAAVESLIHPEDHDRVMEEIDNHLTRRTPFTTECRLRTRSGAYLWFGIRGQAVWNADGKAVRLAGAVSDITGRKEAEQALRDSTIRFRQIFEQIEDAVLFFKPGTCSIIDLNPAAVRLYGYTRKELMAEGLSLVCRADQLARVSNAVSGIQRGESLALD
ncbi:PAS domain S-box protein, partial [bacterium]